MWDLIATGGTYLFPDGRALKLLKNKGKITNSTNPFVLTQNISLTVLDCYAPPPLHCVVAVAVIAASVASPNPVTIGSAVYLISEIYENC